MSHSDPEQLAASVAGQIEAIVAAAERAAEEFRAKAEAAASQEAQETRQAAEVEARRIRQEAATWAAEYLEDSKRVVDEFAAERIAKIGGLTDELIQGAEAVQRRLSDAQTVRRQIYDLISSLGAVAEAIALEAQASAPELARPPLEVPAVEAMSGEESRPPERVDPDA
jgi:cell division septum initiation protein DivIVA